MKLSTIPLPAVALCVACTLVNISSETQAFSLLGTDLSTNQRDFRVFNNFTGAAANNNIGADTQFPGYGGADVAIWKASVEWGSEQHGNGTGDPLQPTGLGSGFANFDVSFQGNANTVGGPNDNTHSELTGNNPPVLAFTEGPANNGWRIRYYSYVSWVDGPDTNFSSAWTDIQGVACHEYGHALGLGHSGDTQATMYGAAFGNAVSGRSINNDDQAGVQFIYGAVNITSKPRVTNTSLSGSQLTINGQRFTTSAAGNEVWFTQATSGGNGTPVKVFNAQANPSGTAIIVTLPGNAGPGDILVKAAFAGHSSLSNALPFDPSIQVPCPDPVNYCNTSPNSVGAGATMGAFGSQSVTFNDFTLWCSGVAPGEPGIFYYGSNQAAFPHGNGTQCVASMNLYRLPFVHADFFGQAIYQMDFANPPSFFGAVIPGDTWYFQFWYRDPNGGGSGFNFSDGLAAEFCN